MKRRELLSTTGMAVLSAAAVSAAHSARAATHADSGAGALLPPRKGKIRVAFAIAPGAAVIDFAGPWEVFQNVHVPERGASHDEQMPFQLYTVGAGHEPITVSGGMRIVPNYTVGDEPAPHVIVVPAMQREPALLEWLAATVPATQATFSVCTGAFHLAAIGLLDGLTATTHHAFHDEFEKHFPDVRLKRGVRFVEHERLSTAAGLSAGMDLALRIVERYFGRDTAQATADYMEYGSTGWQV